MTTKRKRSTERNAATVQARVPHELEQAVERYAEQRDLSFSGAVRELLHAGLISNPGRPTFMTRAAVMLGASGGAATYTCLPEDELELEAAIAAMELDDDDSADAVRDAWREHGSLSVQMTVEQARRAGLTKSSGA